MNKLVKRLARDDFSSDDEPLTDLLKKQKKRKRKRKPKYNPRKFFVSRDAEDSDDEEPIMNLVKPAQHSRDADSRFKSIVEGLDRGRGKAEKVVKRKLRILNKKEKLFLWLNPGTDKILELKSAVETNRQIPAWSVPLGRENFSIKNNKLYFFKRRILTKEQKRGAIKKTYFTPNLPSTIVVIHEFLQNIFANVTRKDVSNVLKSIETYQLNAPRRLPQKIKSRFLASHPGSIVSCDLFFPQVSNGWEPKQMVVVLVDMWSRYSNAFSVERKNYETIKKAMLKFFRNLGRLGVTPRRSLNDKGTDLAPINLIMEAYRLKKDGKKPMVLNSLTGMPVSYIEALNSEYQRRAQVFATAGITNDISTVLPQITDQLNNQKIPGKSNFTPNELIRMSDAEVRYVNRNYVRAEINVAPIKRLPELKVGDDVRILQLNRKEQFQGKFKQFAPKWSKKIHRLLKKSRIKQNYGYFRYYVSNKVSYYRWELLKIPSETDTIVPNIGKLKSNVVRT